MAKSAARERLIAPWLLLVLGALLGLALYAVKPSMGNMTGTLSRQHASDLSISYLQAWLRLQPDSPRLLEILTRQYLELGRWDEAYSAAAHLVRLSDPATYNAGIRLQVRAAEQKAFEYPPENPRRATEIAHLIKLLNELVERDMDVATMKDLATTAKAVGAQDAGIALYGRLAESDPEQAAHWYATLGQMALTFGRYELASRAYFKAQDHSISQPARRQNFLDALRALQSGGMVELACDRAPQHLGQLANDVTVLRFLIRLAQQADRPELVIRYGRTMAKQISMGPQYGAGTRSGAQYYPNARWMAPGAVITVAYHKGQTRGASHARSEEDYELLYNAFIQSGALADAQRIAQRALEKPYMDRRVWLTRLATVAQWNGQPKVALVAWVGLADEYDDATAWQRLLVLAPQMEEDHIYLKALLHAAGQDPGNIELVTEVIAAYERLGNPEGGLSFLQRHPASRQVTELLAGLAERSGHDDLSLQTWRQLQEKYGPNPSYAMHMATLLYAHMKPKQALAALREASAGASGRTDPAFWKAYVALARLLGQNADIDQATRGMLTTGTADASDYTHMEYLYYGHPVDAARIAEAAFRQTGQMAYLLRAMQAYGAIGAWHRIHVLLKDLTATQHREFEQSAELLQARATYLLATGDPENSLRDLRNAYRLPGGQDAVGITYLWTLLSVGTTREARRVTRQLAAAHGGDSDYADVLAAASMQLGQPRRALAYIKMEGPAARKDPLWLMAYADVRDALGEPDMAWRIRREAWRILARQPGQPHGTPNPDEARNRRQARVSLGQIFRGGDVSLSLLMQLLRQGPPDTERQAVARSILGDVQGLPALDDLRSANVPAGRKEKRHRADAAANALVLTWALSGEHNALAKAWLANRYVSDMLEPDSAKLSIALLDGDKEEMTTILRRDSSTLPIDTKIQALDFLGRLPEAQSLAFEALAHAPDNDSQAQGWLDLGLRNRPSTGLTLGYDSIDPLETQSATLDTGLLLANGLGLKFRHVERLNRSTDKSAMPWVPTHDRETSVAASSDGQDSRYELSLGSRDGLSTFATGKLSADWALNAFWNTAIQIGVNNYVDNSALLSVGASKNFATGRLSWDGKQRWFANASVEYDRYNAQGGPELGTGLNYAGAIGYHLRIDDPELNISGLLSQWRYNARSVNVPELARLMPGGETPNAEAVLPEDTLQYGVSIAIGSEFTEQYQHKWQPFLEVSWIHDQIQGWGLGVRGGLGGSVLGRDRLGLFISHEAAGQGNSQPTTQAGLFYRLFY